jgi:hypothetical protein
MERGRQRETMLNGLTWWHKKKSTVDILNSSQKRELWRDMISNAYRLGPLEEEKLK